MTISNNFPLCVIQSLISYKTESEIKTSTAMRESQKLSVVAFQFRVRSFNCQTSEEKNLF